MIIRRTHRQSLEERRISDTTHDVYSKIMTILNRNEREEVSVNAIEDDI